MGLLLWCPDVCTARENGSLSRTNLGGIGQRVCWERVAMLLAPQ